MQAVVVLGRKQALEGGVGLAPERPLEVGAAAVEGAVLAGRAGRLLDAELLQVGVLDAVAGEAVAGVLFAQLEPRGGEF